MKQRKITPKKKAAIFSDQAIPLAIALADALLTSPAPAGMGRQCDAVYPSPLCEDNPDVPRLRHCCHTATRRMVIRSDHRTQTVKRCDRHAQSLRLRVAGRLAYFTIESDEPLRRAR